MLLNSLNIGLFKQDTLSLVEFGCNLWLQGNGNMLLAVEHIHRHLFVEVVLDNIIDNIKTCLYRNFLDVVARELLQLFICQVIDKVLLCSS